MIKECTVDDKDWIEAYIGENYPQCLYLYLDLKRYGIGSDSIKCWYQEVNHERTCVCLLYHTALHVYSSENAFDKTEILPFVKSLSPSIICASKETIEVLCDTLSPEGYICEYGHVGKFTGFQQGDDICVERATEAEVEKIARLLYEDDDIGASYSFDDLVAQIRERISEGFVRSYVIKDKEKVLAHVGTGAEVGHVCTINYVITDKEYRGRGLSTRLLRGACHELAMEGKEIYSVYYPDNSRRLHHKMGFEDCCECGKLFIRKH